MDFNAIVSAVMSNIVFYLLAFIIIVFALMMVTSKNLVHSALFMIVTFLGVAGIYVMLQADFLAVVQIMVYIGAISILLVFGVMLSRRDNMDRSNLNNSFGVAAFFVAAFLFVIITRLMVATEWIGLVSTRPVESTAGQIADLLLGPNMVAFEAAGLLLLVAMVGAIILGKGVDQSK
ncbi:MAG: NADH-quinone oxidoreductase subunit J [Clostridiales bacterium]|jgi:NADH-quinone oxidoreductase subunit J|nr:NADH-quinone oxidoreductase subunit J [Eubacteriales bacterium]MDH7566359.1 NADH-quinone oxidoreductase subunit J [Clostridiales bacterium]